MKKGRTFVTEELANKVIALEKAGLKGAAIAQTLELSRGTVSLLIRTGSYEEFKKKRDSYNEKHDLKLRAEKKEEKTPKQWSKKRKVTQEMFDKVKLLTDAGVKTSSAAKIMGVSASTICNIRLAKSLDEYFKRIERFNNAYKHTEPKVKEVTPPVLPKEDISFDRYNSIIVKLNAIEYSLAKIMAHMGVTTSSVEKKNIISKFFGK